VIFLKVMIHNCCCVSVWQSVVLPNSLRGMGGMFARMHWSKNIQFHYLEAFKIYFACCYSCSFENCISSLRNFGVAVLSLVNFRFRPSMELLFLF